MFAAAKRFVSRHGPSALGSGTVVRGRRIGAWLHNQRTRWRKNLLQPDRAEKILALGVALDRGGVAATHSRRRQSTVEAKLALVEAEAASRGPDSIVSTTVVDGVPIGRWVDAQRSAHRAGRLAKPVFDRLSAAGIPMSAQSVIDRRADRNFDRVFPVVAEFVAEHGPQSLRSSTVYRGVRVGAWLASRRAQYRAGRMPDRHARRLTGLGLQLGRFTPAQKRAARWGQE